MHSAETSQRQNCCVVLLCCQSEGRLIAGPHFVACEQGIGLPKINVILQLSQLQDSNLFAAFNLVLVHPVHEQDEGLSLDIDHSHRFGFSFREIGLEGRHK